MNYFTCKYSNAILGTAPFLWTALSTKGRTKCNEFVLQQFSFCFLLEMSRNRTFWLGPNPGNQLQMGVLLEQELRDLWLHPDKSGLC